MNVYRNSVNFLSSVCFYRLNIYLHFMFKVEFLDEFGLI